MKYKLVIFDFDGTLADTFPWFLSIADQVADAFRLKRLDPEQVDQLRRLGVQKILKQYELPLWKLTVIGRYVQKMMTEDIHRIGLFQGVKDLLDTLAGTGVQLALVSSNSYTNVRKVLEHHNIDQIGYYECGVSLFGKQARFKRVLEKSGVPPGEALCVGDEPRDIQAAHAARIPFGAVAWGYTPIETLMALSPREVFHTVGEIYEKITL
ncbi:MAG: HAD hydrolase-like protein [Anaerolineaceae bacterium]|nr:HAD hydrolase-like protein [Anaerolineaceae bacterium]